MSTLLQITAQNEPSQAMPPLSKKLHIIVLIGCFLRDEMNSFWIVIILIFGS